MKRVAFELRIFSKLKISIIVLSILLSIALQAKSLLMTGILNEKNGMCPDMEARNAHKQGRKEFPFCMRIVSWSYSRGFVKVLFFA